MGIQQSQPIPPTRAVMTETRDGRATLFKALFAPVDENKEASHHGLLKNFKLDNNAPASPLNWALDIGPEKLIDSADVTGSRSAPRIPAR